MKYKRIFIFLMISTIVATFLFYQFVLYPFYIVKEVSIEEISSNPKSFDGWHVLLRGSIIKNVGLFFGPKYELKGDTGKIALGGKGALEIDLEPHVSYTFDGSNYTKVSETRVVVIGYVRYVGLVMDAPPYNLDVEVVKEE